MEEKEAPPYRKNQYSNRRGNRLYANLGVRDLRELLDKKRSERGLVGEGSLPPPDPSYNYLKDPLRESDENGENRHREQAGKRGQPRSQYVKNHPHNRQPQSEGGSPGRGSRNYHRGRPGPGRGAGRDIENPLNIKVEFSTSTGEHVYTLDEQTVLPTIKHVPDRLDSQPPQRWGHEGGRGRGRGRGGRQRRYASRTIRNQNQGGERRPAEPNQANLNVPVAPVDEDENWDDKADQEYEEADNAQNNDVEDGQGTTETASESTETDEASKALSTEATNNDKESKDDVSNGQENKEKVEGT